MFIFFILLFLSKNVHTFILSSKQALNNKKTRKPRKNDKELAKKEHQTVIPLYAEEITISKKMVKVGEILLSKRRVIEEENVNVDTIKERISLEYPDGRKQKLTGY